MCGFVGLIGSDNAAAGVATALQALQHRGQDACGIASFHEGRVNLWKDLGMVTHVFGPEVVKSLRGSSAIGHVRYPTVGAGVRDDAQPFHTRRPGVLMAHNGNVTNVPQLDAWLAGRGIRVQSQCDVEPILLVFAEALRGDREADVRYAVASVFDQVRGAYTCVALCTMEGKDTLVAFRDPFGIRPGVYGKNDAGAWCAASESVALDGLGFDVVGDIPPGSVVIMRPGEAARVIEIQPKPQHRCMFERIYFARPDSRMDGERVFQVRWDLGARLGEEWRAKGLKADVVVPIPDTSRPAAQAMAETLGLPFREGFIKNRYSGRTFIMPDQQSRTTALRLKLNPIPEIMEGKRVILVDDSVVRGTTIRRMADLVRTVRPAEVHLAVYSPPVRHPCFYGIDMPSEDELVAARLPEKDWPAAFGVDSVTFLSVGALRAAAGGPSCLACFDGIYPVPVSDQERSAIVADRRPPPRAT